MTGFLLVVILVLGGAVLISILIIKSISTKASSGNEDERRANSWGLVGVKGMILYFLWTNIWRILGFVLVAWLAWWGLNHLHFNPPEPVRYDPHRELSLRESPSPGSFFSKHISLSSN